jgi:hypothetical protein
LDEVEKAVGQGDVGDLLRWSRSTWLSIFLDFGSGELVFFL